MATVPFQQTPSVNLDVGQAPLFSPTNIQPVQDTGTVQGINNLSKAQMQFAQIAAKLQDDEDELNAGEAVGNYQDEAQTKVDEYLSLKGSATVATVDTDINTNKPIKRLDQLNSDLSAISEKYLSKLTTKNARDIFNSKYSAYKRIHISKATKHSIKEKQAALVAENTAKIELHKEGAKNSYETWNQPDGDYEKFFESGQVLIKNKAILNGQNTDIENGPLSSVYLKDLMEYKIEVSKEVVKRLTEQGDFELAKQYENSFNPDKTIPTNNTEYINKKHEKHNVVCTVNGILNNNSNQNDGQYLSQASKMSCLKSNHFVDDGLGGSVRNGLHSNEVNVAGSTKDENINTLEQIRNQSIFYKLNSNKTLIKEHQPTHLFAVEHIGVAKADSLYLKAQREYELPEFKSGLTGKALNTAKKKFEEEFKKNPENQKIINAAIVDKYNDFIIEATGKKFSGFYGKTKITFPNEPKRSDFDPTSSGSKKFREAREEFKNNPINQVQVNPGVATEDLEAMTGTRKRMGRDAAKKFKEEKLRKQEIFKDQIANDLGVIKKGINYDIATTDNIDFVTGLRPIKELKEELKDTITDPEQLADATKDLETKYNKLKNERTGIYNESLNNSKEIVFTGELGDLEANGIDIEMYTEKDQKILKKGQPAKADVDTVVELINNPALVRDNLNSYSDMLNRSMYMNLKNYAKELQSENKYVEATGNVNMLKNTLNRNSMGDLHTSKNKKKKAKYVAIYDAWLKEINARQINNKNTKLTMGEKQDALNAVLLDTVNIDRFFGDTKNENIYFVDQDDLQDVYVDVPFEGQNERVFISKIPAQEGNNVLKLIKASLREDNEPVTQQNIAEYWLISGRAENEDQARKNITNYYMDK